MRAVSLKTRERGKASDWITSLCSPYNVFWQKSSNSSSGRTQRDRKSPPNENRCIWFVDGSLSFWFVMQMRERGKKQEDVQCYHVILSWQSCCCFFFFFFQNKLGVAHSQFYLFMISVCRFELCFLLLTTTTRLPWCDPIIAAVGYWRI